MTEIVLISGKGGTGKTSIAAAFSYLAGQDIVLADCDVDAADLHLLMQPDFNIAQNFYSGHIAEVNADICNQCGRCVEVCRFGAITVMNGQYGVEHLNCEGCGYCSRICPTDAIMMKNQNVGKWFISNTRLGSSMVHACLGIGAENSGKLVAQVKKEAKRIAGELHRDFVLVDGSPGIGCPVISSLSGSDFVVLITEPTVSGLHDLKRVFEMVKKFHIRAACIINKFDLNLKITSEIEDFLKQENIIHLVNIAFDDSFTKAMIKGQTVVEFSQRNFQQILTESWEKIKKITKTGGKKE